MSTDVLILEKLQTIENNQAAILNNQRRLAQMEKDVRSVECTLSTLQTDKMMSRLDVKELHPDMPNLTINKVFLSYGDKKMMAYMEFCRVHAAMFGDHVAHQVAA